MHPIKKSVEILQEGGIVAYPTEAVYGLGCDPGNEAAVLRLVELKQRSIKKGLILIAASWKQIAPFLAPIPPARLEQVQKTWPGAVTWIFPATALVPEWIKGEHTTVAVRVVAHPIAREICEAFGKPIVSTSANHEGEPPARDAAMVVKMFDDEIDYVVPGDTTGLENPTPIYDALTGIILRKS